MRRVVVAVAVTAGALITVGGAVAGATPDQVPPPATIPPPTLAPATTQPVAPATTAPATAAPPATADRAGTAEVDVAVAKSDEETWSLRRIATTVGIAVVALAVIGYAYGKIRSTTKKPTSSALVASAD